MGHLLLFVAVIILEALSAADICSHLPGYTTNGRSCFKFYSIRVVWADAEAACVADGGHLASIHSSEEQDFVANLANANSAGPWIGLTGTIPTMTWSDGTDLDYENWFRNEPNEIGDSCTKLKYYSGLQWQDKSCSIFCTYICRIDNIVDQRRAMFTRIPGGVPVDAAVVSSSSQMVTSVFRCIRRCQQDTLCVHFIMSEDGGKYLCETYSSLYRPPTTTPPTVNYQKVV